MKQNLVTFQQGQLLKDKGFNAPTNFYYITKDYADSLNSNRKLFEPFEEGFSVSLGSKRMSTEKFNQGDIHVQKNKHYTGRLYDRNKYSTTISAPEQWQVVEWLSDVKKIDVSVRRMPSGTFAYQIATFNGDATGWTIGASVFNFLTRKEAYSAAFDYVLKELK